MGCKVSSNKPMKKKKARGEHLLPTSNVPSLTHLDQQTQRSASPQPGTTHTNPPPEQVSQTTSNNNNPPPSVGRVGFHNHPRPVRNLDLEISPNAGQAFVYGSPPRHSPQTNMPYYSPSHPIDIPHRHSPHSNIVPFQNPPYPIDMPQHRYSTHYPFIPTGFHYPNPNHTPPSHSPSQGSLYSTPQQQSFYHMDSHFPPLIANRSDNSAPFLLQEEQVSGSQPQFEPSPPFDPASEYPMSSLPFPHIYNQAESPSPRFNIHNNQSHSSVLGLDLQPGETRSPTSSSGSLPRNFPRGRMTAAALERHNENYTRGTNTPHTEGNRSTGRPATPATPTYSVHQQDGKVFISIPNSGRS